MIGDSWAAGSWTSNAWADGTWAGLGTGTPSGEIGARLTLSDYAVTTLTLHDYPVTTLSVSDALVEE